MNKIKKFLESAGIKTDMNDINDWPGYIPVLSFAAGQCLISLFLFLICLHTGAGLFITLFNCVVAFITPVSILKISKQAMCKSKSFIAVLYVVSGILNTVLLTQNSLMLYFTLLLPILFITLFNTRKAIIFSVIYLTFQIAYSLVSNKLFDTIYVNTLDLCAYITVYIALMIIFYFVSKQNYKQISQSFKKINEVDSSLKKKQKTIIAFSHNLRTHLSNIMGIAPILFESADVQDKRLVNTIVASVKNIADIIDLIDGKKSTHNNRSDTVTIFNPGELIEMIGSLFSKHINSKYNISEDVLDVKGNEMRVKRIILVIYDFFRKFIKNNDKIIDIYINVDRIKVPEFPIKYRFDFTYKDAIEKGEENMAELDLASDLVASMGGHFIRRLNEDSSFIYFNVCFDEEYPKGTHQTEGNIMNETDEFNLHLPDFDYQKSAFESKYNNDSIKQAKILIVEDNIINQQVMSLLLQKYVSSVELAINGKEAVDKVAENNYDLILMDIQMPVMDGIEATKLIRRSELEKGTHIPIISVTANAMAGVNDKCRNAGMDDYITKPFNINDVLDKMRTLIKK